MESQYPVPQHVQPLLDQDTVNQFLGEIAYALNEHQDYCHPELDWSWTKGTGLYGRIMQYIRILHQKKKYDWLKFVSPRMDFVFSINNVPMQFSKDTISNPSKKHRLLMNAPEYEQFKLFANTEPEIEIKWRVMVEPHLEDEELAPSWTIALVGFNQFQAIVAMQSIDSSVAVIPATATHVELPEAKDIDVAPVFRRRTDEQKDNGSV